MSEVYKKRLLLSSTTSVFAGVDDKGLLPATATIVCYWRVAIYVDVSNILEIPLKTFLYMIY